MLHTSAFWLVVAFRNSISVLRRDVFLMRSKDFTSLDLKTDIYNVKGLFWLITLEHKPGACPGVQLK